jgi:hypothetical protein
LVNVRPIATPKAPIIMIIFLSMLYSTFFR